MICNTIMTLYIVLVFGGGLAAFVGLFNKDHKIKLYCVGILIFMYFCTEPIGNYLIKLHNKHEPRESAYERELLNNFCTPIEIGIHNTIEFFRVD